MKPLRDYIVIEMLDIEKETKKGGLFYQAKRWEKPSDVGKILAVGPEVRSVEVNNYYLINAYAVQDTAEKLIKLVKEGDVKCLVDAPTNQ